MNGFQTVSWLVITSTRYLLYRYIGTTLFVRSESQCFRRETRKRKHRAIRVEQETHEGRAGCLHRSGKRGRGALPCVEHRCKVPRIEDGEDGSDFLSLYLHPLAAKYCAGGGIGDEITEQTQSLRSRNILLMSIRWTIAGSVSSAAGMAAVCRTHRAGPRRR